MTRLRVTGRTFRMWYKRSGYKYRVKCCGCNEWLLERDAWYFPVIIGSYCDTCVNHIEKYWVDWYEFKMKHKEVFDNGEKTENEQAWLQEVLHSDS